MKKLEQFLTEFNGQTFASNEDVIEHLRIGIKHLLEQQKQETIKEEKRKIKILLGLKLTDPDEYLRGSIIDIINNLK